MAPGGKEHRYVENRIRLSADPKVFFNLTGKFDKTEAMRVLMHAGGSTLLAIRAMGGRVTDSRELYGAMAQALGLPSAKSFLLVRAIMAQMGWIDVTTSITTDGTRRMLQLTEKGIHKAAVFGEFLHDALPGAEEEQDVDSSDAPSVS